MDLEGKCRELRAWIEGEQATWIDRKLECVKDGSETLAADAHARICAFASVLRVMHNLGIAVEK